MSMSSNNLKNTMDTN